jgi:hypothetical protein
MMQVDEPRRYEKGLKREVDVSCGATTTVIAGKRLRDRIDRQAFADFGSATIMSSSTRAPGELS